MLDMTIKHRPVARYRWQSFLGYVCSNQGQSTHRQIKTAGSTDVETANRRAPWSSSPGKGTYVSDSELGG